MGDNNSTSTEGRRAEEAAARFLARKGLAIVARNVRCRGGEIDLVCRDSHDSGTLVFVEVRLRRNADYGGAAASITAAKRRRIVLAARHYLAAHGGDAQACRFDCVLLDGEHTDWLRDAFSAD